MRKKKEWNQISKQEEAKTGRTVGHTGIARLLQPTGCLPEKPHFNQRSGKWWEHVTSKTEQNYKIAQELYASFGVDTEQALTLAESTPISMHCWQLDDLTGFEDFGTQLTGGIQATGNFPEKSVISNVSLAARAPRRS